MRVIVVGLGEVGLLFEHGSQMWFCCCGVAARPEDLAELQPGVAIVGAAGHDGSEHCFTAGGVAAGPAAQGGADLGGVAVGPVWI